MLKFKDFLYTQDLFDLEQLFEAVDDHQPLNGKWDQPLTPSINHARYRFDVPGDNCGPGCYAVSVSGSPDSGVSISFSRAGSYSDQHKGVGTTVFKGVLKALSEYITALKPKSLSWSAVTKSVPHPETGKIVNPEARAHVYEGWALRNLFPDKYVGMEGQWIRRDVYDTKYVPQGFPTVPEGITGESSSGAKREALDKMRQDYQANQDEIYRRREEEQRREREEREQRRRERMASALADPQRNPGGVQEGDIVFLANPESNRRISSYYRNNPAKVTRIELYSNDDENSDLWATVRFADSDDIESNSFYGEEVQLRISEFVKATPEAIEELRRRREERIRREEEERRQEEERQRQRQERMQARVVDPEHNPEGIKEGDIVYLANAEDEYRVPSSYADKPGKVERVISGYYGDDEEGEVYASVRFATSDDPGNDDFNGRPFNVKVSNLKKATPEHLADRERRRQEFIANLISSQETNPNGVQEGDEIITNIPGTSAENEQNGLRGKITKFKPERNQLFAYVDWDAHAQTIIFRNIHSAVDVKFLHKATPEEIQRIARQRREREIEQQVQRNREVQQRRTQGFQSNAGDQSPEDLEALINHPANPQHLKPGDYVTVVSGYRNRGRGGIIVSLEKPYWSSDNVTAYVRFHGSRAAQPTRFWSIAELQRDESEQAQALQSRQQQQQDRQQRIATATNGLQIGDTVSVASGVHRGKTGRIVGFRASGQNISVTIATHDGNFNVNARAIARESAQPVAAESLSFFRYFLDKYHEVV